MHHYLRYRTRQFGVQYPCRHDTTRIPTEIRQKPADTAVGEN